jgi:hypothetical protein
MTTEEIQKQIREDLIPEAMSALRERVTNPETCSPSDIKLVFELAKRFTVNLDDNLEKVPKSQGVLTQLEGFKRKEA